MKVFSIQAEKLLCWIFRTIVYGLKTIGLAPVSLQTKSLTINSRNTFINVFLYSKMGLFFNLVLTTLTLIMAVVQMLNLASIVYSNQSSLNSMMDIAQYSLEILTACLAMVNWAFRQKKAAHIMNRLLDVHRLLSAPEEKLSDKRMLILLAMHMTFNVFLWITFVVSATFVFNSWLVMFNATVPIFINYWFLMEYSIVLGYVAREFESLNANLLTVEEYPNDLLHTFLPNSHLPVPILPTPNLLDAIKLFHIIRTTLYEVSQDVEEFFSIPILPIILLFFFVIVYNVYYLIIPLLIPNSSLSLNDYILTSAFVVVSIYPLILLSFYVTRVTNKAQLTGHLVHKLLTTERNPEIITELKNFSLHLIHEHISFTACGFFTLDFRLLQSILVATATYLVIVIQFLLQSTKT